MINAYVLHSFCYTESSLIVKFFTKEYGIVNLVAKGAKRKKNSLAAILQPFVPLLIYWKTNPLLDLATLYHAEAVSVPHKLFGFCLFGSLYINELLLKLLPAMEPHAELFDFYQKFLSNLQNADKTILEKNLRSLEKKILAAIGYKLQLDQENITGAAIDLNAKYYFDFETGLSKQQCSTNTEYSITGKSILALHKEDFADTTELQEAKLFMRYILANFLGNKPLLTRKLFT